MGLNAALESKLPVREGKSAENSPQLCAVALVAVAGVAPFLDPHTPGPPKQMKDWRKTSKKSQRVGI